MVLSLTNVNTILFLYSFRNVSILRQIVVLIGFYLFFFGIQSAMKKKKDNETSILSTTNKLLHTV